MVRLLVLAVFLGAIALAQAPIDGYHVGGGVSAPVVLERQEPEYSEEARVAKLQGTVLVSVVVGEDGSARDLRVRRSLGLGLDENAIAAVSRWRFRPGMKDGQPVPVQATIEVNFRLLTDKNQWRLERVAFNVPQDATQPRILQTRFPPPSGSDQAASMSLSFDVNEQGIPTNVQVERSSNPEMEDEVTVLIREWRFQAAFRNGIPISAHVLVDFSRGDYGQPRTVTPKQ